MKIHFRFFYHMIIMIIQKKYFMEKACILREILMKFPLKLRCLCNFKMLLLMMSLTKKPEIGVKCAM